ncbi:MAG: hypothetical protein H0W85_10115 [Methylotenera sp.]|nr:hypothetical protein [Methylotenera sp.]
MKKFLSFVFALISLSGQLPAYAYAGDSQTPVEIYQQALAHDPILASVLSANLLTKLDINQQLVVIKTLNGTH